MRQREEIAAISVSTQKTNQAVFDINVKNVDFFFAILRYDILKILTKSQVERDKQHWEEVRKQWQTSVDQDREQQEKRAKVSCKK